MRVARSKILTHEHKPDVSCGLWVAADPESSREAMCIRHVGLHTWMSCRSPSWRSDLQWFTTQEQAYRPRTRVRPWSQKQVQQSRPIDVVKWPWLSTMWAPADSPSFRPISSRFSISGCEGTPLSASTPRGCFWIQSRFVVLRHTQERETNK